MIHRLHGGHRLRNPVHAIPTAGVASTGPAAGRWNSSLLRPNAPGMRPEPGWIALVLGPRSGCRGAVSRGGSGRGQDTACEIKCSPRGSPGFSRVWWQLSRNDAATIGPGNELNCRTVLGLARGSSAAAPGTDRTVYECAT